MKNTKTVAVITGAAQGIGLALSKACLNASMQVVMADNNVAELCNAVEQLSEQYPNDILGVVCDVSQANSLRQLAAKVYETFPKVDFLFNNAGISGQLAPIWEVAPEHVSKVFDVNLFGAIHGIQAFVPKMLGQGCPGHIINMASLYGLCSGSHVGAYAMSKHALVALSESLHFDLQAGGHSIAVSVVCPSFTNTKLMDNACAFQNAALQDALKQLFERARPAEDVADYILRQVLSRAFYIFPDAEVKAYFGDRAEALLQGGLPKPHALEKLMVKLRERAQRQTLEQEVSRSLA